MAYDYLRNLLRPRLKGFTDTEKIIAEYFIQLGNKVVNKTLSNIAEDTGVSESTIFKFVKKLVLKVFKILKLLLPQTFARTKNAAERSLFFLMFVNLILRMLLHKKL